MEIAKTFEAGKTTLALTGRLDTNTAPQLETIIKNDLGGVTELVFDFKKLEYISSAGLRVILSAQKTMNAQGSMKIVNVRDEILEVFDITGFSDILTIENA